MKEARLLWFLLGLLLPALSIPISWSPTAPTQSWDDPYNWIPSIVPTFEDTVTFNTTGEKTIYLQGNGSSTVYQVKSLYMKGSCLACSRCLTLVISGITLVADEVNVGDRAVVFLEGADLISGQTVVTGAIGGDGTIVGDVHIDGGAVFVEAVDAGSEFYGSIGHLYIEGNLNLSTAVIAMEVMALDSYDRLTVYGRMVSSTITEVLLLVDTVLETILEGRTIELIACTKVIGPVQIRFAEYCEVAGGQTQVSGTVPDVPCQQESQGGPSVVVLFPDPKCSCLSSCSFHGTCRADTGTCECDLGYSGQNCESIDCPGQPNCLGKGICSVVGGVPTCQCRISWGGPDCSVAICPGSPQCSGNGMCHGLTDPPICDCSLGYDGIDCSQVSDSECQNEGVYLNGSCVCPEDWRGNSCQIPVTNCPGTPACSGLTQGVCNTSTVDVADHYCICLGFWESEDCSQQSDTACGECGEHGFCQTDVVPAACACDFGFIGDDCSTELDNGAIPLGIILGATVGAVVLAAVVFGVILFLIKRDARMEEKAMELD